MDKATAAGTGQPQAVGSAKSIRFDVWGTATSFNLQVEASGHSGNYRALPIWDVSGNTFVTGNAITTPGIFEVDVQGLNNVRTNLKSVTGGNVNATGTVIT
ncbi:hypothetical protein [Paenibacillus sp. SN-8-1]|uniref:hypothetical protein n=1 Tax=Paenibacillus sp. SN-8-1 TaxID=3435409 RepID=UPI003D9A5D44